MRPAPASCRVGLRARCGLRERLCLGFSRWITDMQVAQQGNVDKQWIIMDDPKLVKRFLIFPAQMRAARGPLGGRRRNWELRLACLWQRSNAMRPPPARKCQMMRSKNCAPPSIGRRPVHRGKRRRPGREAEENEGQAEMKVAWFILATGIHSCATQAAPIPSRTAN